MILAVFGFLNRVQASGGDFFIDLIPSNPVPNSEVIIKMRSYSFDVNRSDIVWQVDGKVISKGMGERTLKIISPDFGQEKNIIASVVTADGFISKKLFILTGNDIDLLWEAVTSTPLAYKGRAMPVIGSSVKITAIPYIFSNKKEIAAKNLIYEWFLNYKKDINASGAGKNSFLFDIKDFDDYAITLKISSKDNIIVFEKGIFFNADDNQPKIVFYEENPLEGPQYNKAMLGNFQMENGEIGIKAEPFFFSKNSLKRLSYEWVMNGEKIISEGPKNFLSLRAEGKSGKSIIGLKINNPVDILQFAEKSLEINY